MSDDGIPRSILLLVLLVSSYAFFAASETAYSYANHVRIKVRADDGDSRAARAMYLIHHFDKLLATILVGTNVVNVFASSVATVLAIRLLGNAGSVVATVVMTLVIFLFAETLPKNIARKNDESYAMSSSALLTAFYWIFSPVTAVFTWMGYQVKSLLARGREKDPTYTEVEFQTMVENLAEEGALEEDESQLIQSAVDFSDLTAKDIMIPVRDMTAIGSGQTPEEIKSLVLGVKYSRIPVYGRSVDHILGILQVRDCLYELMRGQEIKLLENLRPTCFVPPDLPVGLLFEEMSRYRSHMAIVADKGKTLGLVTMEDLLEELVGDIYDEEDIQPARHVLHREGQI